jgi:uncharacterized protein
VFRDKKVFITGGSSGIGKQLAADFLRLGSQVGIASNDLLKLERARAELSAISPNISAFPCDVGEPQQVKSTVQSYVGEFGAPDIVVNNAGYAVYQTFEETSTDEILRLLAVNLAGVCVVTREFLPSMIQRGTGNLVFMASIAGRIPITPCSIYGGAKHAVVALATALRAELKRFNIGVNLICPGRVETDFFLHPTFVERQRRPETQWTVSVEGVSQATIAAVRRHRFMTYVPKSQGVLVWLNNTFPFIFRPALDHIMEARVNDIYSYRNRSSS